MTAKLYLIDAPIYVFRGYFSIPDTFKDSGGEAVNAVYGYTQFLLDLLLQTRPSAVSVAFDESLTTCFRNDIYPEYKANRDLPDENLKYQLQCCQRITELLGLHQLCLKNYEADDIIGTLLKLLGNDHQVVIVSRDKDLGQLLRAEDLMWDFAENQYLGPAEVQEKFGVAPHQIADYLALAGDSVDNIPGAPGIGAKTAAGLLQHFGSLENIFDNLIKIPTTGLRGAKRIQTTLTEHEDLVRTFQRITQIFCDIPIKVTPADLKVTPDMQGLETFCDDMRFGPGVRRKIDQLAETLS